MTREDIRLAWTEERGLGRARVAILAPFAVTERGLRILATLPHMAAAKLLVAISRGPARRDAVPVGTELANRVAARLVSDLAGKGGGYGSSLTNFHRYYCGTGLFHGWSDLPLFVHATSEDGFPARVIDAFETLESFVDWLANQTDLSLSGIEDLTEPKPGNQRLTIARLEAFAIGDMS